MLRDELGVFLRLLDGSWPFDRAPGAGQDVKAWQIARLRRLTITLKHELCLPVLLAGARTLTGGMFAELVYMLEVFAFRYKIVCNGHASRPAALYYQQALKMRAAVESGGRYTLGEFRGELRQLIARHAGDQLFKQLLAENLRYSNRSQRLNIRHFLSTLEDHHEWLERNFRNPGARPIPSMSKVIDVDESTIEHIYPQNASVSDHDPRLELVKQQLGNLTFFGSADNVAAGDKSFSAKSATNYAASAIAMTHALASNASWTVKDVRDRENRLLAAAARVFVV